MILKKVIRNFQLANINNKYFSNNIENSNKKILVEFIPLSSSIISISYFANALSKLHDAEIVSYKTNFLTRIKKVKFQIVNFLYGFKFIYKSFGCKDFIYPNNILNSHEKRYVDKLSKNVNSKEKLLHLKFKEIKVGDYIYDDYLRTHNQITVNVNSSEFRDYLKKTLCLCFFWYKKLDPKIYKALIISHSSYLMGLIGKIGVYKDIPTYRVSLSSSFRLSKKYPRDFLDFKNYPKLIKKINPSIKNKFQKNIEKNITEYFLKKRINLDKYKKNFINEKLNVLISAHCFTDAVHYHGVKNCFIDFYEWLNFIGKLSNKLNYNWFIKLHPSDYEKNLDFINLFLKRYPRLILLDKDTKNFDLIKKIDAVLTVYGSVGREFTLFNIPVINASTCGPHCGYNFNYNIDNKKNYLHVIKNLKFYIKKFKFKKKEIFDFFFLRFFLDYSFFYNAKYIFNINEDLRTKRIDFEDIIEIWSKIINKKVNSNIERNVLKFIKSKNYRFISDNSKKFSEHIDIKN